MIVIDEKEDIDPDYLRQVIATIIRCESPGYVITASIEIPAPPNKYHEGWDRIFEVKK